MLNPVKSETSAFQLAIGSALAGGASVALGALTAPVYGLALFAGLATGAVAFGLAARDPDRARPLQEAAHAPHPAAPPAKHRILVVADEALEGPELRRELMRRVELWPELLVVAPVLSSRLHFWASDFDRDLAAARARLASTLAWAAEQGLDARGEVGDPDDPLAALEDALRRYGADEVIVATHPPEHAGWLEAGLLDRIRSELDVPVTQVVVDPARHAVEIGV